MRHQPTHACACHTRVPVPTPAPASLHPALRSMLCLGVGFVYFQLGDAWKVRWWWRGRAAAVDGGAGRRAGGPARLAGCRRRRIAALERAAPRSATALCSCCGPCCPAHTPSQCLLPTVRPVPHRRTFTVALLCSSSWSPSSPSCPSPPSPPSSRVRAPVCQRRAGRTLGWQHPRLGCWREAGRHGRACVSLAPLPLPTTRSFSLPCPTTAPPQT